MLLIIRGYERVLRHINLTYTPSAPATAFSRYTKQPVNSISPSRLAGPDFHSPEDVGFISDIETLLKRAAELLVRELAVPHAPMLISVRCRSAISLRWHSLWSFELAICQTTVMDKYYSIGIVGLA